jgi:hypothetical protein
MVDLNDLDLHSPQDQQLCSSAPEGGRGCVINLSDDSGSAGGLVLFMLLLLFLIAMVIVLAAPGDGFCFEYC